MEVSSSYPPRYFLKVLVNINVLFNDYWCEKENMKSVKFEKRRALIFTVIFTALALNVSVGCVFATTHYVDPGESIQAAVNAADPGDTIIVRDGTFFENVDVNKRLSIQSENGSDSTIVQAADSKDPVFEVKADYVTISGFTVKGSTAYSSGIYLLHANYCTISNNNAKLNRDGIELWYSDNNNTLMNNTASNNSYYGILLRMSTNNTLTNNTMSGNKYNFGICCVDLSDYAQDIGPSNKVNGKPIYYLVNQQNQQIPDDAGFVGLISSTNITVRDLP
jgi:parallel beta-helix repeat protein